MKPIKVIICLALVGLILNCNAQSQESMGLEYFSIEGPVTASTIKFGVALPATYQEGTNNYPVIYFLHGMDGDYGGWQSVWIGDFFRDQAHNGHIPEVILVFPDGKDGFWGDHFGGDPALETNLIQELIPHIDRVFRTDTLNRLIMGWSAGGVGALNFYIHHPELFRGVVDIDGSTVSWEEIQYFQTAKANKMTNSDSLYYYEYFMPVPWVLRNKELLLKEGDPSIFLVASYFKSAHQRFRSLLISQNIPARYIELDCEHQFDCIMPQIKSEVLEFVSSNLK